MTREKLLRYGKEYLHDLETACCKIGELHLNFVRESIKALEEEPKAEIALNRYRDLQDYFGDEAIAKTILENQTEFKAWLERLKWNTKKVDELARKLEALEQEPKKGHWIDERNDYGEIIHWHCSNCYDDSGYTTTCKWDYCPNCGADMREPKRGHWIPTYGNVKCSVCGSVKDSREVGRATHYCDFCGAKMESEE